VTAIAAQQERPLALLTRPWFWVIFVASLWVVPLIKGLGAEFPDPIPGYDTEALAFELATDEGRRVSLADLRGNLVLVAELPLANAVEAEAAIESLRVRRKRLRGLGSLAVNVMLAHGAGADPLAAAIDENRARKPTNVFLLDEGRATFERLCIEAGHADARILLFDRHGRLRGAYGAGEEELDRCVAATGQLANWSGSDPPIGEPVRYQ
jgi:hypothetical protein